MSDFEQKFTQIWKSSSELELIKNLDTELKTIRLVEADIPCSVTDRIKVPNSYAVSIFNMSTVYSEDELVKLDNGFMRWLMLVLIKLLKLFLRLVNIDRMVIINNYLLSTNFFPDFWESSIELDKLEAECSNIKKDYVYAIRSVNKIQNPNLYKNLMSRSWLPIVSRQVYIFNDWKRAKKHKNYQRDLKLLNDKNYVFKKPVSEEDFVAAQQLYEQLYLKKYSEHNIQFQAIYLQALVNNGLMHLKLLWDVKSNVAVGIVGLMGQDGVITVPVVGYDQTYSQDKALYRRVMIYAIQYASSKDLILNCSSGAPSFKKLRGAQPELEYFFVKVDHTNRFSRVVWKAIHFISVKIYAGILQRNQL